MARIPVVTRTMTTTHAIVMCVDIETAEVFNKEYDIPRTYKDDEAVLSACKCMETAENIRLVSVVHVETSEALYKMTEEKFMACAEKCGPRKAKEE